MAEGVVQLLLHDILLKVEKLFEVTHLIMMHDGRKAICFAGQSMFNAEWMATGAVRGCMGSEVISHTKGREHPYKCRLVQGKPMIVNWQ